MRRYSKKWTMMVSYLLRRIKNRWNKLQNSRDRETIAHMQKNVIEYRIELFAKTRNLSWRNLQVSFQATLVKLWRLFQSGFAVLRKMACTCSYSPKLFVNREEYHSRPLNHPTGIQLWEVSTCPIALMTKTRPNDFMQARSAWFSQTVPQEGLTRRSYVVSRLVYAPKAWTVWERAYKILLSISTNGRCSV